MVVGLEILACHFVKLVAVTSSFRIGWVSKIVVGEVVVEAIEVGLVFVVGIAW